MTTRVRPVVDGAVQRVAAGERQQPVLTALTGDATRRGRDSVQDRVAHLHHLATRVMGHYLRLAETLYLEHDAVLWQRARAPSGDHYASEEAFWENAFGIKRRTGYQLVAIGRMLLTLRLPAPEREALSALGLHKMDVLVPILQQQTSRSEARAWINAARIQTRAALRDTVQQALGRPTLSRHPPGQRLQASVMSAMPDLDTRRLAAEFFAVGRDYVGSDNAVAIVIAAMQEALGTWHAHTVATRTDIDSSIGAAR